jgi:hypothetical protein
VHLYCPNCSTNIYIENEVKAQKLNCPTCNQEINLELLRKQYAEGGAGQSDELPGEGASLSYEPIAWELEGGWLTCLWLTCFQVLTRPWVVFRSPASAGYVKPYLFSAVMYYLAAIPFVVDFFITNPWDAAIYAGLSLVVIGPVIMAVGLFGLAGLQHGLLTALKIRQDDFVATFRVAAYSAACCAPLFILYVISMIIGLIIGWDAGYLIWQYAGVVPLLWWITVMILGLATVHMADYGKVFIIVALEVAMALAVLLIFFG